MDRSAPSAASASDPGSARTSPSWPTSEHASGAISGSAAPGSFSACATPVSPHTVRAYSSSVCWKPPHVPRKGMPSSRATRTAASAPASLAYGLPGSTHTASKPARVPAAASAAASAVGIQ